MVTPMVVKKYMLGNAEIRVYRPKLADEALKLRERNIRTALQAVGRSVCERRAEITNDNTNTSRDI